MKTHGPTHPQEYGRPHPDATNVEGVVVLGYDPDINKWMALEWPNKAVWLAGGGKEPGESFAQAAIRELQEETGYTAFTEQIQLGGPIVSHYYNDKKAVHRRSYAFTFLFILDHANGGDQALESHEEFAVTWLDYESLRTAIGQTGGGVEHWLAMLERAHNYISP